MYRQLTLSALALSSEQLAGPAAIAVGDVIAAWHDYLEHYNKGRGVVLIGHSQGTAILRYLIRNEIDPVRSVRRRIVSALLLGGDVTVQHGSTVGGDFQHIPACTAPKQFGCVIAFSTFNEPPPDDTMFGLPGSRFDILGLPTAGLQVLCTNPAALGGGAAPLDTLLRTEPFPGTIGLGLQLLYGGTSCRACSTPWLKPPDRYSGQCVTEPNGANVLLISPLGPATQLHASPDATWGLHLADANIALGNLVDDVGREIKAYLRKASKKG